MQISIFDLSSFLERLCDNDMSLANTSGDFMVLGRHQEGDF